MVTKKDKINKIYHKKTQHQEKQKGNQQTINLYRMELANNYKKLSELDSARHYYQDALTLSEKMGNESNLAIVYQNYGNFLVTQSDYTLAEHYLLQSLAIFEKLGVNAEVAAVNNSLATISVETGELDEAEALNAEVSRSVE